MGKLTNRDKVHQKPDFCKLRTWENFLMGG